MVESSDDPIPANRIECNRICRTDCETKLTSLFVVPKDENTGEYMGLSTAPENKCYNFYDWEKKEGDTHDEDSCKFKLNQAESNQVIISQSRYVVISQFLKCYKLYIL